MDFPISDPIFHDHTLNLSKSASLLPPLLLDFGPNRRHDPNPPSNLDATKLRTNNSLNYQGLRKKQFVANYTIEKCRTVKYKV